MTKSTNGHLTPKTLRPLQQPARNGIYWPVEYSISTSFYHDGNQLWSLNANDSALPFAVFRQDKQLLGCLATIPRLEKLWIMKGVEQSAG